MYENEKKCKFPVNERVYKGDTILFDNPFSLKHNLIHLEGIVEGIDGDVLFVKTKYGVAYVSEKHVINKLKNDNNGQRENV